MSADRPLASAATRVPWACARLIASSSAAPFADTSATLADQFAATAERLPERRAISAVTTAITMTPSTIQSQISDDLAQTLYAMRETAPGEMERTRVADVLASLQALRSAVNAERTSGGDRAQAEARVHARLMSFEAALRALRSPTDYRL